MTDETANGGVTTVYSTGTRAIDTVELHNTGAACPDAGFMVQVYPTAPKADRYQPTLEYRIAGGSWHSAALTWVVYSSGDPGWQTGMLTYGIGAHSTQTIQIALIFPSGAPNNTLDTGTVSYTPEASSGGAEFGAQIAWSLLLTAGVSGSGGSGSGSGGSGSSSSHPASQPVSATKSTAAKSPSRSADPDSASATTTLAASPSSSAGEAATSGASPSAVALAADARNAHSDSLSFAAAIAAVCVFGTVAAIPLVRRRRARR